MRLEDLPEVKLPKRFRNETYRKPVARVEVRIYDGSKITGYLMGKSKSGDDYSLIIGSRVNKKGLVTGILNPVFMDCVEKILKV